MSQKKVPGSWTAPITTDPQPSTTDLLTEHLDGAAVLHLELLGVSIIVS